MSTSTAPLSGVNVLEIAHYIAGPYCAQILGDQGADVVKLEPPAGEPGRRALPLAASGESLYYASYNRNKRNVCIDLRSDRARTALDRLLSWADVVVTNYSAGVPEKLGFGWDRLHAVNPAAVMVFISGFGSYSTMRDYVAFDGIVTAMSGIVDLTGDPAEPPMNSSVLLADHSTAVQAALAATAALVRRGCTGEGSYVEVSMLRSLAALLGDNVPAAALGQEPTRTGRRSDKRFGGLFRTADGHVMIAPLTAGMWASFCTRIGHPEWGAADIVRDRVHVRDAAFRARVEEAAEAWLATRTSEEVLVEFQGLGIPCGAVKSVAELVEDDEPKKTRLFEPVDLVDGTRATVMGRVFDWEGGGSGAAPVGRAHHNRVAAQGADGVEVLLDAGLSPAEVDDLVESGVLHGTGARDAVA